MYLGSRATRLGRPLAVLVLIAACTSAVGCGGAGKAKSRASSGPPRLVATLEQWRLPGPVSAEVALGTRKGIVAAGGLTAAGVSANGIFLIDPKSGRTRQVGALGQPTHDAGGALLGSELVVFGGGVSGPARAVQAASLGAPGRVIGELPRPRADLATAQVGGRAYLVGGYDGTRPSPDVLATGDGRRFVTVGRLAAPVRYPAVAALGGALFVFGGERSGHDTTAIQRVDLGGGGTRVIGQLPIGLSHAAAFALGGHLYLVGGRSNGRASDRMWRVDPARGRLVSAGHLPIAVYDAGLATLGGSAYLVGGTGSKPLSTVIALHVRAGGGSAPRSSPAARSSPAFQGRLLIADRGNNRLLVLDATKHLLWRYPSRTAPAPRGGFYFPDDAFFTHGGSAIISNEEENHTIVRIGYPSGRLEWSYGHPRRPGSAPGYLNQPDDAYLLKDGSVTVADAKNCRILEIGPARATARQIGTTGNCVHHPPRSLGYPNGDTPLSNGDLLISEIHGSYVDEITRGGRVRWSVHLPIAYPSDPQQLGPDLYLVADYSRPGGIYEFTRSGRIVWAYHPRRGSGMLDHPSLAERLPNGLIGVNDDYRDRVALIDPRTKRIVWQYGHTGRPGRKAGRLRTPDGFDLLVGSATPTHPQTG